MDTIPITPTTYIVIAEGVGNTPTDRATYPLHKNREPRPILKTGAKLLVQEMKAKSRGRNNIEPIPSM